MTYTDFLPTFLVNASFAEDGAPLNIHFTWDHVNANDGVFRFRFLQLFLRKAVRNT